MLNTRTVFPRLLCLAFALALAPLASHEVRAAPGAAAAGGPIRTLDEYRHFRAATIDILGRMPSRGEVEVFEQPDFDFDQWIDNHLKGGAYVDRLVRVYMDLLRLEPNPSVFYFDSMSQLSSRPVTGPDGSPVPIYFRFQQRRGPEALDASRFCFSEDEMTEEVPQKPKPPPKPMPPPKPGVKRPPPPPSYYPSYVQRRAKKIPQQLLDERTVLVRPWWLYRDYREPHPNQRYSAGWTADPEYRLVPELLHGPDGKPITDVRVCKEEAQAEDMGHVYASGRTKYPRYEPPKPGKPPVYKPVAPIDTPYATQHKGEPLACDTKLASTTSIDCGCGKGLERCVPGSVFELPSHAPLGPNMPFDETRQSAARWYPYWWSREVVQFFTQLFAGDVDFREVLTGKGTVVNGPLASFYKSVQRGHCCGFGETQLGMTEETEPLFEPAKVPAGLAVHDVGTWKTVKDRGAHAAGILTMPMFLEKFATARARAAVVYNAFLCKSFVAENLQLAPSSETNLMKRPGCSTCHATLEPLAAYFARIEAGDFVFLPKSKAPIVNPECMPGPDGRFVFSDKFFACQSFYDPGFADGRGATLKFAYGSPEHADMTPVGLAQEIVASPEFSSCAASRVASSFLGRPLTVDDDPLLKALTSSFKDSGFKMRALVRGILRSGAYRKSNNLSSTSWRGGGSDDDGDGAKDGGGR